MPTTMHYSAGPVFVTVHGTEAPSDEEWLRYLETGKAHFAGVRASLIITEGGGPNGQQRALLTERYPEFGPLPVAVVSDSPLTRGIVTALRWLGKNIRAFRPTDLAGAFEYLDVPIPEREALLHRVAHVRSELRSINAEERARAVASAKQRNG
ncbi:MAG TPA: hypothetical protein VMI54_14085 [Polyangiaceae bacterium]|nr:hypothetical protein [Polyangiaceae bacterium]